MTLSFFRPLRSFDSSSAGAAGFGAMSGRPRRSASVGAAAGRAVGRAVGRGGGSTLRRSMRPSTRAERIVVSVGAGAAVLGCGGAAGPGGLAVTTGAGSGGSSGLASAVGGSSGAMTSGGGGAIGASGGSGGRSSLISPIISAGSDSASPSEGNSCVGSLAISSRTLRRRISVPVVRSSVTRSRVVPPDSLTTLSATTRSSPMRTCGFGPRPRFSFARSTSSSASVVLAVTLVLPCFSR